MNDPEHRHLLEELSRSRIFEDYQNAFSEATGLPVALRPVEAWHPVQKGSPRENPFCALMARTSRTCAACLQVQDQLAAGRGEAPRTVLCFAGLTDTAIPIQLGEVLVGYLQTGQAFVGERPDAERFTRVARQLMDWGLKTDLSKLEEAWFHSRVLDPAQYEAAVRLLGIFAQHLAIIGNQLMVRERTAEPPAVARARQYIADHQSEAISLGDVSQAVNMSSFYFCKVFKKATGLKFTDYLSRVRIERAKSLLLNPNVRITEVAFEVGFQTLTHFNRVFRKVVGESPTAFRHRLPTHEAA